MALARCGGVLSKLLYRLATAAMYARSRSSFLGLALWPRSAAFASRL